MILTHLKTGWRNIANHKLFSAINIAGLAISFAVATLIFLWVADELNFDRFHSQIDHLYTIYEHQTYSDGQELYTPCTPFPLSQKLAGDFNEVENATTFCPVGNLPVRYQENEFNEGPVFLTDSQFMNIFSFRVIEGNAHALQSPDKVIITKQLADVFFKGEPAVGKVLNFFGNNAYEVGAVLEDPGENSSLDFKVLIPLDFGVRNNWINVSSWGNNWPRTMVQMAATADMASFDEKIVNICKDQGQESTTLHSFPFKRERLYSYSGNKNRVQYIYQFLAIAFIIVLIASINFINFSTARAEKRRPEVGIRKTMGASRFSIVQQFIYEKGLMVLIALAFSVILVSLLLPLFSRLADKHISLSQLDNPLFLVMLLGVILITLFLSVAYPALYISSFAPARAIRRHSNGTSLFSFKSSLVIIQFALSIGLIICSIAISLQLKYISNYDLGYNKDNLVYLTLPGNTGEEHAVLSRELSKISGVTSLTKADKLPFWGGNSGWGYDWEGKDPERSVLICSMHVDPEYFSTLGIEFESGESFSERFNQLENRDDLTVNEAILNQEAIRRMGMEEPVGKYFGYPGGFTATIVGVAKNFNFESLRVDVEPMVITPLLGNPQFIILRLAPANFYTTVNTIKKTWAELIPKIPCELGFFDESIEQMYNSELRIAGLFKSFTLVAILIACIGLFGLSLYSIEIRRKEIGIRKVNGARAREVMTLLNIDFIRWVIIAFIIATPIAYLIMQKWLENFAYKTHLDWWIAALAGLLAIAVALITVSWQSWRVATRNPVEALRYE